MGGWVRLGAPALGGPDDRYLLYLKEVECHFNRRELGKEAFVNHPLRHAPLALLLAHELYNDLVYPTDSTGQDIMTMDYSLFTSHIHYSTIH